jgi:L-ascorbate metabolism protein UlaG (beta-lactamase superfamily)
MDASLTFVGTATTILRIGSFTLLTDPNFIHKGERVHLGYGLFSKRRTEPAMQPADLPKLDALVLSHLHADHFDRVARARLRRDLPIVTTRHAATKLKGYGFADTVPLDTWETHTLRRGDERLTITSAPGTHGPGPVSKLLPPVMGSVIEYAAGTGTRLRLYVTGDTLFRPWLRDVADRFGPLDCVVAHLGGTRALGVLVTMDAEQGVKLVDLLKPAVTIPVHYDDYTVFRSPLKDFLDLARRRGVPGEIRTVGRGDTVALPLRGAPTQDQARPQGLPLPNATSS